MNYRHVYMLIIEHAKKEAELGLRPKSRYFKKNFPNQYFEFHHILPRSLFPLWAKRKSNIVALSAREHFFCHQLLTKIYPNSNMYIALWYLATNKQNKVCTSKEYQKIKENYKISKSHHENIKKASNRLWNSGRSEEIREKISNSIKAIYRNNPEIYLKNKGQCHISNKTKLEMHNRAKEYYKNEENRLKHSQLTKAAMEKVPKEKLGAKKVRCIELDMIFDSVADAAKYLNYSHPNKSHIGDVCNGKAKTTLGYHWEWC